MKTLADYQLLYDADCPMCALYSSSMVKTGMLDKEGRVAYQEMSPEVCTLVDRQRAIDEIALVNTKTGEVSYGVHSLFKILGNAFPVFKPLFNAGWFIWVMSKLYAFISYNRRVIIPVKANQSKAQPTFRLGYRLAYLVFTACCAGFILTHYNYLLRGTISAGSPYREYFICGGQIIFQGLAAVWLNRNRLWEYLGNMMTISFTGALLLLPVLALSVWAALPAWLCTALFLFVAALMLIEHMRRVRLLAFSGWLTLSWVLYRLLVLIVILY